MPLLINSLTDFLPPDLPAWLPETQAALHKWTERQRQRLENGPWATVPTPAFPYQDLLPSARLSYELVGWNNVRTYLTLFEADPSPFVDARFKQRPALEQYAVDLLTDLRHSWKRGAADWLVRRRADGQTIGVLHLYELSCETFPDYVPHCCVGYALAAPFRRQGYGFEALGQLLEQASQLFGRTEARALSDATNVASQALLRKCDFALLEERPATLRQPAEQLWQCWLTQGTGAR